MTIKVRTRGTSIDEGNQRGDYRWIDGRVLAWIVHPVPQVLTWADDANVENGYEADTLLFSYLLTEGCLLDDMAAQLDLASLRRKTLDALSDEEVGVLEALAARGLWPS